MTGLFRRWWQRFRADVRLLRQARRDAHETAWGGPDHLDAAAWDELRAEMLADGPRTGIDTVEGARIATDSFIRHAFQGIAEAAEKRWKEGAS